TPKGIFYKANDFYEKAKYDDAIREYKKLLERGLEDGNLYYNLGNAYFKKGELGEAIVNYERAKRLIPRDRDLEANYKHAGSLVKGKGAPFKKIWILRLLDNFFNSFTLNTMTIMISLLYLAIALTIIVGVVLRIPRMQKVLVLVILGGLFLVNAVFLRNRISLLNKEAIAIKEKADVRFGPFQRATTHFTLYEGTKVEVLSRKDEWAKVRRPDGKVGWVKSDTLEMI
ncbi:MAG: tetratricopeptide repeat protein, partial [Candidatus Omnitrophica bacterium]|nr:tetratricopeptide repeat protein [Candidatus Omnitrophota bacterium]